MALMTHGSLMKVESISECSPYFWPALSYNWSWKTNLGHFRVAVLDRFLLYITKAARVTQIEVNPKSATYNLQQTTISDFAFFLKKYE